MEIPFGHPFFPVERGAKTAESHMFSAWPHSPAYELGGRPDVLMNGDGSPTPALLICSTPEPPRLQPSPRQPNHQGAIDRDQRDAASLNVAVDIGFQIRSKALTPWGPCLGVALFRSLRRDMRFRDKETFRDAVHTHHWLPFVFIVQRFKPDIQGVFPILENPEAIESEVIVEFTTWVNPIIAPEHFLRPLEMLVRVLPVLSLQCYHARG
jgi:hypothetical protein